jgi:hypothetical protein
MARDEFLVSVKRILASRVGNICSKPSCASLTIGPNEDVNKSTSIGVAAHITAASEGGPRYNSALSNVERASIENGIWLCQNCAKEIDADVGLYPVDLLKEWKSKSESRARDALGQKLLLNPDIIKSDIVVIASKQKRTTHSNVIRKDGKVGAHVTFKSLNGETKVNDVWFPIILGGGIIPPKHNLWTIIYQNQSSKIESDVLLSVNFDGSLFKKIDLKESPRIELYEGGLKDASYAKFHIKTLLPKEKQGFRIIAKKGSQPIVECVNRHGHPFESVYYFEVIL